MMTSLRLALYLTGFCLWRIALTTDVKLSFNVRQGRGFVLANIGDSVTLQCFYEGDVAAMILWYKQALGQKPRLISSFYKHSKGTLSEGFKNNSRFTLETKDGNNHLRISNVITSDSATYYCVSCYGYSFRFAEGTILSVKGSGWNIPTLVHQSESETVQTGGSVTLNCTVHTGTCDGEHSVYWFRDSDESHPGLIYTHGGRNDECVRKTNTHTCAYNLPIKRLNFSHAGTYYCAVASCGHILLRNRIKLDLANAGNTSPLLLFLSGSLAFTTILVVALIIYICKRSCQCTESQTVSTSPTATAEGDQEADNLHYAALSYHKASRSRKQRDDTWSECVYSGVRQ